MYARLLTIIAVLGMVVAPRLGTAKPDEGMFVPTAIAKDLPWDKMKSRGFELTAAEIWNTEAPAIKDAILQVGEPRPDGKSMQGYGSAEFVSDQGLILTNHHVAFEAIHALSSTEHNYVENGFAAKEMADEAPCKNLAMQLTKDIKDVTAQALEGITAEMTEQERDAAIRKNNRAIVESERAAGNENCEVKDFWNGTAYYLFAYDMFRDVRVVYMPPRAIGEFGGETDNWMWPRHTGDFAYFRAYVAKDGSRAAYSKENVPFKPKRHLKVSIAGYKEGDACFIMGYPGETKRFRDSFSVGMWQKVNFPQQIEQIQGMIDNLEAQGKDNAEKALENSNQLKQLYNAIKNFRGNVEGMARLKLVDLKKAEEAEFQAWAEADADRKAKFGTILPEIGKLYESIAAAQAAQSVAAAVQKNRSPLSVYFLAASKERMAPRAAKNARKDMVEGVGSMSLEEQRAGLARTFKALSEAPEGSLPKALAEYGDKLKNAEALAAELLKEPLNGERAGEVFDMDGAALEKLEGGVEKLGVSIAKELATGGAAVSQRNFNEKMPALRRRLIAGLAEWRKTPLYPDANLTLRFTHGVISGYEPKNGVYYRPMTTIDGVLEKEQAEGEFKVPANLKDVWKKKDWGRYADKNLGSVVTCLLSDTDITGGNSGSPTMNGKGELIGIAFDGNYEAMTSDFKFMPKITRTISVDSRYVLWVTDKVAGLKRLIDEMTIVGG